MTDLPTVVAALDGHDHDPTTLGWARTFARTERGGRLFAAHSVEPPSRWMEHILYPWSCFGDDVDALQAAWMQAALEALQARHRDRVPEDHWRIGWGRPTEALARQILHLGPSLVVCGTHGGRTHPPGVLGSTALALAQTCPCPVLLVPPHATAPALRRILVALDLGPGSRLLLQQALELAHVHGATVQAIHVTPGVEHLDHAGILPAPAAEGGGRGPRPPRGARDPRTLWQQLEETLDIPLALRDQLRDVLLKPRWLQGDPARTILEQLDGDTADTVLMLQRTASPDAAGPVGRQALMILARSTVPTLLVPAPTPDAP
jgi:nucleotide-binding universal stress UspA family protein